MHNWDTDRGSYTLMRPLEPTDPAHIGGWRLIARLGEGGMGAVYLAAPHDPVEMSGHALPFTKVKSTGTYSSQVLPQAKNLNIPTPWDALSRGPVALKVIHRDISADSRIVARFRNEIDTAEHIYDWTHLGKQVAAQIPVARKIPQPDRPAEPTDLLLPDWYAEPKPSPVPAPLAASLEPGNLWYAMQYLPYATLEDSVRVFGPPDEDALLFLARRLLRALTPLQERGVAHRDVKPSNLALGRSAPGPELALLDLGISHFELGSKLTTAGAMHPGTPPFMSPEQVQGVDISPASDLFSTASTLVWLASAGRSPAFTGESSAELMHRIATAEPDLSAVPNSMTDTLAAFLEKDPEKRPDPQKQWGMFRSPGHGTSNWLTAAVRPQALRKAKALAACGIVAPHIVSAHYAESDMFLAAVEALGTAFD